MQRRCFVCAELNRRGCFERSAFLNGIARSFHRCDNVVRDLAAADVSICSGESSCHFAMTTFGQSIEGVGRIADHCQRSRQRERMYTELRSCACC